MSARFVGPILAALLLLHGICAARAEEAIARSGKKYRGRLLQEQGLWVFRDDQTKTIQLHQLSYIKFEPKFIPLPKAPLTRTLLFANQQRLTGLALGVAEKVSFVTSWGHPLTLHRAHVVAIEQANDSLLILHDDFETSLKAWHTEGNGTLDTDRAFYGKSSMRLDRDVRSAARTWLPGVYDGSIRLFFYDPATPANLRWTFSLVLDKGPVSTPGILIDRDAYRCAKVKENLGVLKASPGWHFLSMEREGDRLRIYVDDACLGQTTLPREGMITGLRCAVDALDAGPKAESKLWIDELIVSRRVPSLPTPRSDAKQDSVWLAQGEQLFGRVVSADAKVVMLDAKFGKRSLAWSQLRGILFARAKETPAATEPEITFRPCPGFPVDCLRAKLVRWDQEKLIVQHDLLGEIAIERDRLDMIRFEPK